MQSKPVIYTSKTCAQCPVVKHWFAARNIEFEERDVENDKYLEEAVTAAGCKILPTTVWGDNVVLGRNTNHLASIFEG